MKLLVGAADPGRDRPGFLRPNLLVWAIAWWWRSGGLQVRFTTPIPASVVGIYMGIATLALVAYVTSSRAPARP
jgi:hypothetical protein